MIPQITRAIITPQQITISAAITQPKPVLNGCPQYIIGNHLLLFYYPFLLAIFSSNQTFHSTTSLTSSNELAVNKRLTEDEFHLLPNRKPALAADRMLESFR
jgi:hypothetical protein